MAEVYKLRYLRGARLRTFLAAADRIIPADADSPGAGEMITAGIVDWAMGRMPEPLRRQFLGLITGIELLGFLFGGRPFSHLSEKAQDRELAWLESAAVPQLRMGFFGLKSYVCMGYYTREDVWKTLDYDGPVMPAREYPDAVIRGLCRRTVEVEE